MIWIPFSIIRSASASPMPLVAPRTRTFLYGYNILICEKVEFENLMNMEICDMRELGKKENVVLTYTYKSHPLTDFLLRTHDLMALKLSGGFWVTALRYLGLFITSYLSLCALCSFVNGMKENRNESS